MMLLTSLLVLLDDALPLVELLEDEDEFAADNRS